MFNILTTLLTFAYYEHLSRNNITNMFTLELHQIPNTLHKHQLTPAHTSEQSKVCHDSSTLEWFVVGVYYIAKGEASIYAYVL